MILGFISPETLNVKHSPLSLTLLFHMLLTWWRILVCSMECPTSRFCVSVLLVLFNLFLKAWLNSFSTIFGQNIFRARSWYLVTLQWGFMCYGLLGVGWGEHGFLILSIHLNSWSLYIQFVSVIVIIHFTYVNQQTPFTPAFEFFCDDPVVLDSFLAFWLYKMFEVYHTHFLPQNTFPTPDLELVISPRTSGFFWWGMIFREHNLGRGVLITLVLSLPLGFLVGRVRKYFF